MKFSSFASLAFSALIPFTRAAAINTVSTATDLSLVSTRTTNEVTNVLEKRAGPWPTHLPNNWVSYSQTGGAYNGAVICAMVTLSLQTNKLEAIIQSFENSGYNMVKEYAYNTWYNLAHTSGLQTSMAIVKATAWFDYRYIRDAAQGKGYMTVMFRFNTLEGLPAAAIPQIANALAAYWRIGHIEANYNPHRPANMKRDNEALNQVEARQSSTCAHKFSTDTGLKVDRYGGNVPLSTSCELHS